MEVAAESHKKSAPAESWNRLALTVDAMVKAARLGRELTATKNSKKRARDKDLEEGSDKLASTRGSCSETQ